MVGLVGKQVLLTAGEVLDLELEFGQGFLPSAQATSRIPLCPPMSQAAVNSRTENFAPHK